MSRYTSLEVDSLFVMLLCCCSFLSRSFVVVSSNFNAMRRGFQASIKK